MNYSEKLNSLIPGGAHTYSRGDDQYPSNAPQILAKGKGAYVWDADGKKYLDYGMALRAITIGYANDRINKAAIEQIENGVNLTRPSMIELKAAEVMTGLIKGADMVKFAKNGSTVTTAALKIARAYTGKKYVCVPRQHPFFSYDDWFIGTTPITKGIPEEHYKYTLLFDYNNIKSLENLFSQYSGQIACVMLEPATTETPCPESCSTVKKTDITCNSCNNHKNNFLHQIKELCHKNGALFILDEMITGFRWHLNGAQAYFGVEPDLSTFGKGMANGFSVAALVGKKEIMNVGGIKDIGAERTFLISTTHGAEMPGLGALVEAVKFYEEENVIQHLWNYGAKLFEGMDEISRSLGLIENFCMDGNYISMNFITKDNSGKPSLEYRTLFVQEMIKNGVLFPWVAVCYSHKEEELKATLKAVESSLKIYKKALNDGIEKYLVGDVIKPVFRKFN
jgi:glutamate-1-semialdehyde 2,1-aminomutase